MNNETLYAGLRLFEWISLFGIIGGPILAVLISLYLESRRRGRDSKIILLRMIMNSRHMPADSNYNLAINLIPIEFNGCAEVMTAWREYIEQVRYQPTEANRQGHEQMTNAKQTTLIFQILRSLGFKLSESDIQTGAYASQASVERDNMYLGSLHAHSRIAETLEKQFEFMRGATTTSPQKAKASKKLG